ncbi:MAG TPA: hypothetical protein VFR67_29360 [Pilimelia sp.]|nr:hypothetical protein [Pilimelia sp.]
MTAQVWFAGLVLCGAAVTLGTPVASGRRRLATIDQSRPRWWRWLSPAKASMSPLSLPALVGEIRRHVARLGGHRWSRTGAVLVAAGAAGPVGFAAAGPVGGMVAGTYAAVAIRALLRRQSAQAAAAERAEVLDSLSALAADLRAGLPPVAAARALADPPAMAAPAARMLTGQPAGVALVGSGNSRPAELAGAAWRLAEQTGAPLADLIERIEADARALDRAALAASAQAAGARATAWLLAALPVGGIALGYGIGVDPLHVLLRTPVGAGCAVGALLLQVAGLAWADRLTPGRLG